MYSSNLRASSDQSNTSLGTSTSALSRAKARVSMDTLEAKGGHSTKWEELRKQARHIEQDLDVKLVSFSKLGSITHSNAAGYGGSSVATSSDNRNALIDFQDHDSVHSSHSHHTAISTSSQGAQGTDDMFKTMSMEIQSLLDRLQSINEQLADFSQKNSPNGHLSSMGAPGAHSGMLSGGNAAMIHTLQRHRDILQDFQHEFNKIKSNIETQREREDLLGSVRRDIDLHYRAQQARQRGTSGEPGEGGPTSADYFMEERATLLRSNNMMQENIDMGRHIREDLRHQRQHLSGMTGRIVGIMTKFPMINSLVHRINWRKKRDSMIMAGVISTCVILILLYWLRV